MQGSSYPNIVSLNLTSAKLDALEGYGVVRALA